LLVDLARGCDSLPFFSMWRKNSFIDPYRPYNFLIGCVVAITQYLMSLDFSLRGQLMLGGSSAHLTLLVL